LQINTHPVLVHTAVHPIGGIGGIPHVMDAAAVKLARISAISSSFFMVSSLFLSVAVLALVNMG
jgi:hypothetical protein